MIASAVVLIDPSGNRRAHVRMHEVQPGTDRWETTVSCDMEGPWSFEIEAWSDVMATWQHDAGIKIPLDMDVELMLEEGARLFDRAAAQAPTTANRDRLRAVAKSLRDETSPGTKRFAEALHPEVSEILDAYPLRELVT